MDWLTTYRVVIDYERRRVTTYTQDGTRLAFQGDKHDIFPQTIYESRTGDRGTQCIAMPRGPDWDVF